MDSIKMILIKSKNLITLNVMENNYSKLGNAHR